MAEGLAVVIAAALSWIGGSRIGQWALIAAVAVLAFLGLKVKWTGEGKQQAKDEANRQTIDNVEKANAAKRDADAANRAGAPDERVRKFYTD